MNYLIIGGSKSGKSHISEQIALSLNKDKAVYIATMKPFDIEDEERIKSSLDLSDKMIRANYFKKGN